MFQNRPKYHIFLSRNLGGLVAFFFTNRYSKVLFFVANMPTQKLVKLAIRVIWRCFNHRLVRTKTNNFSFYENRKVLRLISSLGFVVRVSWLIFSLVYSEISAVLDKWKRFVIISTTFLCLIIFSFDRS